MKRKINILPREIIKSYHSIGDFVFDPNKQYQVCWDANTMDAITETGELIKRFFRTIQVTVLDIDGNVLYQNDVPMRVTGVMEHINYETRPLRRKVRKYGHKNETPGVEYKDVLRQYKVVTYEDFDMDITLNSNFWQH